MTTIPVYAKHGAQVRNVPGTRFYTAPVGTRLALLTLPNSGSSDYLAQD